MAGLKLHQYVDLADGAETVPTNGSQKRTSYVM
jgi:hypothetical protein